jgi:hypothetical protein
MKFSNSSCSFSLIFFLDKIFLIITPKNKINNKKQKYSEYLVIFVDWIISKVTKVLIKKNEVIVMMAKNKESLNDFFMDTYKYII